MEIITPMVEPFVSEVGNNLLELTKRHVRYLFCFKSIVKDFIDEHQNLEFARDRVRQAVESASRNAEVIEKDVQKWLKDVDEDVKDVQKLKEEIEGNKKSHRGWCQGSNRWCPKWGWQYRLSRKVERRRCSMFDLRKSLKFKKVAHPAPLPGIEFSAPKDFQLFKSAEPAFHQIIQALKSDQTHMVGLYGMGGAGKTTLAKAVGKKVREEETFDEVVVIVVSKAPNFKNIQGHLAESLGMKLEEEGEEVRAKRLYLRFVETKKKILIILDDVWKKFDLKSKIGIPFGDDLKGCKILLTTRNQTICVRMSCQPRIVLNELSGDEGFALLKKHAGIAHDESHPLNDLAVKVAKECKGLPLAIVTIGSALKEKGIDEWTLVFEKFKKSKLEDIRNDIDVDEDVYAILKVSYDYLEGKEIKFCFLLCSLFPEDYKIPLEELVRYGMGLGLFPDVDSIEQARSRLRVMVNNLKASCLLTDAGAEGFVKMHDVVRDVALGIASKGDSVFLVKAGSGLTEWPKEGRHLGQYTAISLMDNEIHMLPDHLVCPKLETLLLSRQYCYKRRGNIDVSNHFFEEMKALKNVSLSYVNLSLKSLKFLTDLKTLELINCNLKDISSLEHLARLEILSLRFSVFEEFPKELGALTELRLLDLRDCRQLKRIPSDVIRRFSQLEELYMSGSFDKWEDEETSTEGSNASLSELNSLSNLVVLFLKINAKCLSRDLGFSCNKLLRYDICVNTGTEFYHVSESRRALTVKDIEAASLITFESLYHTLEYLCLKAVTGCDSILPSIDKGLISLVLEDCKDVKCIIDTAQIHVPAPTFSNLVKLSLRRLNLLREICCGPYEKLQSVSLENLETLSVEECPGMCSLFPAMLLQRLYKLKAVTVTSCNKLEEIFQFDGLCHSREENLAMLSSLARLDLANLPQLRCIWKGPTHIVNLKSLTNVQVRKCKSLIYIFTMSVAQSLVQLKSLAVSDCESLKHLLMTEGDNDKEEEILSESHHSAVVLPNLVELSIKNLPHLRCIWNGPSYHVNLPSLTYVEVRKCKSFTYLFTLSFAQSLVQLKSLKVSDCESLEQLVIREEGDNDEEEILSESHHEAILLPNLAKLSIEELPQLRCIWNGPSYHVNLPSLTDVEVRKCKSFTYLFTLSFAQSLVQLKSLKVSDCESLEQLVIREEGDNDEISSEHDLQIQSPFLSKLESLKISSCERLEHIFPVSFARVLVQLGEFTVENAPQLKQVFYLDDGSEENVVAGDGKETALVKLPKLKVLRLDGLASIISFCPENFDLSWPALEDFTIDKCSNLSVSFVTEVVSKVRDLQENLRILRIGSWNQLYDIVFSGLKDGFFKNLEELSINNYGVKVISLPNLRTLRLRYLQELEGLCKSPTTLVSSLENLTSLYLYHCDRLRNIFSPSLAQNLSQLQNLFIYDCGALEEIIVEEDEENQFLFFQNLLEIIVVRCPRIRRLFAITVAPRLQKLKTIFVYDNSELEEVFGDRDVADVMDHKEIVLPQLDRLSLDQLPSLTKFCPVGYHFIFPSLCQILVIKGCPKMSTRFFLDEDTSVRAKAKALKMGKQDEIAEFPSQPSIHINCFDFHQIQESLPPYIENDEQSINQEEEEINTET